MKKTQILVKEVDPRSEERRGKHLTVDERSKIEAYLNQCATVSEIAKLLNRPVSTIAREIERNCEVSMYHVIDCANAPGCEIKHVCGNKECNRICSKDSQCKYSCSQHCEYYERFSCEHRKTPPYLCNGCPAYRRNSCRLSKRTYIPELANKKYENRRSETRKGFNLTEIELDEINRLATPMIRNGCSPFHTAVTLKEENDINISVSSLYRLINSGELDARNLDLRNKVRRKPRKGKRKPLHNEQKVKVSKAGREYGDFLKYISENETFYIEMDCVEGKQSEPKTLLTLHWKQWHMQIAMMMPTHNSACVVDALDTIEQVLGPELFASAFPLILTDNGQEFTDIVGMERSVFDPNARRTKIFFCEPNRSDEKGSCENNHKLIRDVIPKGKSLMPYQQHDITLMMNHINSYKRKDAMGKSAYDIAMAIFPSEFFDRLGLYKIDSKKVTLHFKLLRDARRRYREERKEELADNDNNSLSS